MLKIKDQDKLNIYFNKIKNSNNIWNDMVEGKTETKNYPYKGGIGISAKCNANCIMCNHNDIKFGFTIDDKSLQEFYKLAPYLYHITFSGSGETSLHPSFFKIVEVLNKNEVSYTLRTNGSLLRQKLIDQILTDNTNFEISIDASSKVIYEQIRIGLDYEQVNKNLNDLVNTIKERKLNSKISLMYVIQKLNVDDIVAFYDKYSKMGVQTIFYNTVLDWNPRNKDKYEYTEGQLETLKKNLEILKDRAKNSDTKVVFDPHLTSLIYGNVNENKCSSCRYEQYALCPAPWTAFFINEDGWYRPCSFLPEAKFGNIRAKSVTEIIGSDELKDLRGKCVDGGVVYNCQEATY